MEQFVKEVGSAFPCRWSQLKELYQLFGRPNHPVPSSLYLNGAPGVGKTTLLLKTLDYLSIKYALVDCIEFYAPKMLYESIINMLRDHKPTQSNSFESFAPCDSSESFLDQLGELDGSEKYVILLKHFDRLHDVDVNVLPVLMRLNDFVPGLNICCGMIGSRPATQYISHQGLVPVYSIHCEQYSKTDLLQILLLQTDLLSRSMAKLVEEDDSEQRAERLSIVDDLQIDFFNSYFSVFLDTFYGVCRNVKELVYVSNANFPIYCRPVINGTIKKNDVRKLWKNMEVPFKLALGMIYCRVDQKSVAAQDRNAVESSTEITVSSSNKSALEQLELPFYTKYLLIAAYLASHNDAKIDKRLFVKHHGKQKKRLQNLRANAIVRDIVVRFVGQVAELVFPFSGFGQDVNENRAENVHDRPTDGDFLLDQRAQGAADCQPAHANLKPGAAELPDVRVGRE